MQVAQAVAIFMEAQQVELRRVLVPRESSSTCCVLCISWFKTFILALVSRGLDFAAAVKRIDHHARVKFRQLRQAIGGERERGGERGVEREREREGGGERHTDTDTRTHAHIDTHTHRQRHKHTHAQRQRHKHTHAQTHTHTHIHTLLHCLLFALLKRHGPCLHTRECMQLVVGHSRATASLPKHKRRSSACHVPHSHAQFFFFFFFPSIVENCVKALKMLDARRCKSLAHVVAHVVVRVVWRNVQSDKQQKKKKQQQDEQEQEEGAGLRNEQKKKRGGGREKKKKRKGATH